MIKSLVTAAALAVTLFAGAAGAQTAQKPVRTADLNLTSAAGARTFDARVRQAARAVCGTADMRDVVAAQIVSRCTDAAVAGTKRPGAA